MINASTFEKLKALNCSAMADEFQNQLNNSKSYNALGFEERLGLLVDAEWNKRQANKLKTESSVLYQAYGLECTRYPRCMLTKQKRLLA